MYQLIVESKAQLEYETSIDWYKERSPSAAEKFIETVFNTIDLICKQPYQSKNVYKNFRETNTKKYPFSILYTIEEKTKVIYIVSIYHHKRNPKKRYPLLKHK